MEVPIESQKSVLADERRGQSTVHRYRQSRPWSVALMASAAAVAMVLLTGSVSAAIRARDGATGLHMPDSAARYIEDIQTRAATAWPAMHRIAPWTPVSWHVQVGAFQSPQSAEAHLRQLMEEAPGLVQLTPTTEPYATLTRARFGGLPDQAAAQRLCSRIIQQGSDCAVVPPVAR